MEWRKELQRAVQEGKVILGLKRTLKMLKRGRGKFAVIASSCPAKEDVKYYAGLAGVEVVEFEGNGYELGAMVRKPFSVSVVLVMK